MLLAEDNLINQTVAKKMLTSLGLVCEVASNGQEAVDLVQSRQDDPGAFDMVLMDMSMPIMGGVEATQVFPTPSLRSFVEISYSYLVWTIPFYFDDRSPVQSSHTSPAASQTRVGPLVKPRFHELDRDKEGPCLTSAPAAQEEQGLHSLQEWGNLLSDMLLRVLCKMCT